MELSAEIQAVLLKVRQNLLNENNECSGAIFNDGSFSLLCGDKRTTRVDDRSNFIWHSHPAGRLIMSLDDWMCFFTSKAVYAALFADAGILVVKKTDFHRALQERLSKTAAEFAGFPSILYRSFIAILADYFQIEIESLNNTEHYLELFRVEYQVIGNGTKQ